MKVELYANMPGVLLRREKGTRDADAWRDDHLMQQEGGHLVNTFILDFWLLKLCGNFQSPNPHCKVPGEKNLTGPSQLDFGTDFWSKHSQNEGRLRSVLQNTLRDMSVGLSAVCL